MNGNCRARTKGGQPCKAPVSTNGLCAMHAEPKRASELGRKSGKARRCVIDKGDSHPPLPVPETAGDVRKALGRVMSDLIARKVDTRVASATAYVGNVMLRAIEVADLEERMAKVENLLQVPETTSRS